MSAQRRVLVIGLDGMPCTLLQALAAQGVMPTIERLLAEGACRELLAPVPEISSTAWATFLTGANPARHGVFGFIDLVPGGYDTYFPNVTDLRVAPLWRHAAKAGLTTLCLNVPGTYPAPAIRGALVAGFVAPSMERAVQPPRLLSTLRELGYQLDVAVGDVAADREGFLGRVREALLARARAFDLLLREERWDLAVAVITETDRLQHFLWHDLVTEGSPLHEPVLDLYRAVDGCVARLEASLGPDDALFLMSDHGFGPAHCQFYVNAWLRQRGLLALPPDTAPLALDGATRAFALDPARIYLHRRDRFPAGSLSGGEADALTGELAAELAALRWRPGAAGPEVGPEVDGPPLVAAVHRPEEVYRGPLLAQAPDLIAVPAAGVQLRGSWRHGPLLGSDALTGTHTRDNALLYARGRAIEAATADMTDVAPTVLGALGLDSLGDVDGSDLASPWRRPFPPADSHGGDRANDHPS